MIMASYVSFACASPRGGVEVAQLLALVLADAQIHARELLKPRLTLVLFPA